MASAKTPLLKPYYRLHGFETKGWFRKRAVLANVPSFRVFLPGNIRMYPHSGFWYSGNIRMYPRVGFWYWGNIRMYPCSGFLVPGNIRQNHPFANHRRLRGDSAATSRGALRFQIAAILLRCAIAAIAIHATWASNLRKQQKRIGGRRPTPSTWGPPETTLRVSMSAWCQRRCASCLRYDMVCCMRVFLSWFCVPVCSLNMRVGQVSEHSSGVQPCFMDNPCFCVLGAVPGAGSSSNSRCSGPLGRPPEERGGPWAPPPLLFHTTKSCLGLYLVI